MRDYWRGSVEAWECDEMGHMNVRFWVRRALDGMMLMATELGCERAFAPEATASLLPVRQHIRFLKEAREGVPLFFRGGVVSLGEADIVLYGEIVHTLDGAIGATFLTKMAHVEAKTGKAYPWPARTKALALALQVEVPKHGSPRSIPFDGPTDRFEAATLVSRGFQQVGLSAVRIEDVDVFNRLYPEGMIGRVSTGVPNLMTAWREETTAELSAQDGQPRKAGAAVLEYRLDYLAWPGAGDFVAVHSGVANVSEKTNTLKHVLAHPVTGEVFCVCEAVAVTFDLVARKVIAIPPQARAKLEARLIKPSE
ncbi:acyl-ACP thioesterase [Aquidulcibacter sp.]|uniref:acyl-ACP thioesterase n=1 Tax=Aquidulcibacter sp. TaxID=2052990 RepID=UPI0025BB1FDA|nr:acyl-ACP thioesterase [Aquidulcibacter sp.]MCA3694936.1 acyl-ACP thioesterase [Aquidulcibacter sp.]